MDLSGAIWSNPELRNTFKKAVKGRRSYGLFRRIKRGFLAIKLAYLRPSLGEPNRFLIEKFDKSFVPYPRWRKVAMALVGIAIAIPLHLIAYGNGAPNDNGTLNASIVSRFVDTSPLRPEPIPALELVPMPEPEKPKEYRWGWEFVASYRTTCTGYTIYDDPKQPGMKRKYFADVNWTRKGKLRKPNMPYAYENALPELFLGKTWSVALPTSKTWDRYRKAFIKGPNGWQHEYGFIVEGYNDVPPQGVSMSKMIAVPRDHCPQSGIVDCWMNTNNVPHINVTDRKLLQKVRMGYLQYEQAQAQTFGKKVRRVKVYRRVRVAVD